MTDEDDTNRQLAEHAFQTLVNEAIAAIWRREKTKKRSPLYAQMAVADLQDAVAACDDRPAQMACVRRWREVYR